MKKTLYISDLDGTLLRPDQTISPFTAHAIRALTEKGMLFSYATARSYATAKKVTAGIPDHLPVITFNGTFILETGTERHLRSHLFSAEEANRILSYLNEQNIHPVVNAFMEGKERFSYVSGTETRGMQIFINDRRGDPRGRPVTSVEELLAGEVFHIACIDEKEALLPAYERFREEFPCVLYRDLYSGETWFEMHPKGATKANAMLELKDLLHCDRVICFGDGVNDISMFEKADECYAVANADDALKAIATDVIESNEEDGVAKWLLAHFNKAS